MNTGFSYARRMINRLVLDSFNSPSSIGLFHGQAGVSIVLALYARCHPAYLCLDSVADHLFYNVSNRVGRLNSPGLADGVAGITWAVEFLVQNGLMSGSADDMCRDSDSRLMEWDVRRIADKTLERGLPGLWHCVWSRIQGNMLRSEPLPYDSVYLSDWLGVLSAHSDSFSTDARQRLSDAIAGNLHPVQLTLGEFVASKPSTDKPGLHDGLAGYVYNRYID